MALGAGELRHRVQILRRATPQDQAGEFSLGWTRVAEVWAAVDPRPGTAPVSAGTTLAPTVFRLRHYPNLTPKNRLAWNARLFEVITVADLDGRHEEMVVTAKELVGVGA